MATNRWSASPLDHIAWPSDERLDFQSRLEENINGRAV